MEEIKSLYLEITKKCNLECVYCYNYINKSNTISENARIGLLNGFLTKFNDIISMIKNDR